MKLASERPTTQSARIYALEEGRKKLSDRLDKIEPMISDMHEILVGLRSIGRAVRWLVTWFGGPTVVIGAGVAIWRYLAH